MRGPRLSPVLASTLAALAAACSPYSPNLPEQPFLCGDSDPVCPDGFTCMDNGSAMVCVGETGAKPDGGGSAIDCSGDSMLEPNNTIQTAFQLPVDTQFKTFPLSQLAICPSGDVDNYAFTISVEQENAVATLTYATGGVPLQMSVLVASGSGSTPIINGAAVPGMPGVVKASPSNLSTGTYYIQVFGPATGGTNTYSLKLDISGP